MVDRQLKANQDDRPPSSTNRPTNRPITDAKEAKARAMAKGLSRCSSAAGVGKTSHAKSIARSLGREYVRVALGGARDEADIRGHRRTYGRAMPGRIIQGMKQAGTKTRSSCSTRSTSSRVISGRSIERAVEVLDPAQNDSFTDHYLGVPFDLSEVLFIATANFIQNIPGPLLGPHGSRRVRGVHRAGKSDDRQKY